MKTIVTIKIKFWLPFGIMFLMFLLLTGTLLFDWRQDRQALVTSRLEVVQFDMATLAREVEQLLQQKDRERVASSLMARSVNTKYRSIFIVNLVTGQLEIAGIQSPLIRKFQNVDAFDKAYLSDLKKTKIAQVAFNEETLLINAYFSLPLHINNVDDRDGVLIARYNLEEDLARITRRAYQQSIYFAAVFVLVTLIFLWVYRQFIQQPAQQIITSVQEFSKSRSEIDPNISGHGELREIADAVRQMSADIVQLDSQRKDAQFEVNQRNSIFDSLFSLLPDLYFLLDANETIIDYRAMAADNLYVPPEKFLHRRMSDVLPAHIGKQFVDSFSKVMTTNRVVTFDYLLPKDGQDLYFEARMAPVPHVDQVVIVVRDVTQQKQNELLILHQAHYDALTDLPNRYLALTRLEELMAAAKQGQGSIAVLFLDLDDFKKINDTLGHTAGDEVLIETAQRLTRCVSDKDTVARLGGDEFVILFNQVDSPQHLLQTVKQISFELHQPIQSENRDLLIATSMGVSIYPGDGETATDLLRNADTAMYHSKAHGKNQYSFFTSDMNANMSRRLRIEECMVRALENQEYEVYYQPQFDLRQRRLVGAEALLRWHSPELGLVSPAEFIPIAEQNGKIIAIGHFVIEQAVAQCAEWVDRLTPEFRIAVNLSPRQFRDKDVLKVVSQCMAKHQLAGHHLEFEVTEGVLLRGYDTVNDVLTGLHEQGISISMDDFGTGYSSLSYLQDYPFDMVKIDRSFVSNMTTSDHSRELVKAIISMAHSLQLKVLAEGVETAEQAMLLLEFDCDLIQGFLMGQAVSAKDFSEHWRSPTAASDLLTQ